MIDDPIAVVLTHIKQDANGNPVIILPVGQPGLCYTPGQLMQASIYDGYIVIAPALTNGPTQ